MEIKELIQLALEARKKAYAPYSHFQVGAALLTASGKVYTGVNVENASFGATNCAERTAVFKAVSEGETAFEKIVIAGGKEEEEEPKAQIPPCGICLQVLSEFVDEPERFQVILAKSETDYGAYSLKELLPASFSL